ncbi:hypothetical protein K32_33950 [Kaistia sp. 32K]|uniref:choline-binding transcriptional repressor BetI n=1 Tax=Kaistia sp. 32K TaxID=2795690 RepID=UPI001915394B|nr:transcriptional regulator BetI [Kaistia sp. 32K]BCP54778.1 hypothetical protein K32_33950 [Kaistia sp. 32K]
MSGTSSARLEAEDVRRRQLIEATIESLAEVGFAACTLMDIGRRAGVSPGLVAHYFGDKEGLLEATLRSMAGRLSRLVSIRLAEAKSPRARVQAVIDANLAPEEFDRRTASVWLAFWGQVIHSARFKRVQNVYQRRMLSNLRHALKQMVPPRDAQQVAVAIAAVIDGLWLRETLAAEGEPESAGARAIATAFADIQIATVRARVNAADAGPATNGRHAVIRSHIAGRGLAAGKGRTFATVNPATGETLARVEIAGAAEVEAAVASARHGQAVWGGMTGGERGRILRRVAAILRERNDELARLETRDTGRPIQQTSTVDVVSAADCLDHFAALASALADEHVGLGSGAIGYSRSEPLGIVAAFGEASASLFAACRNAGPALAAGNAVVLLTSDRAPLSAARLAEIMTEADMPDGVFNVLHGPAETDRLLRKHPAVTGIAERPTGGSTVIVFDGANLEGAVSGALSAGFGAGSTGARVLVQSTVREAFVEALVARVGRLVVGDPMDPNTQVGALVSEAEMEGALRQIEQAREAGAQVLVGGDRRTEGPLARGAFLAPTVLDLCTDAMAIVCDPSGGPILPVLSFDDEDEAIGRLNAALAGGPAVAVFTRDLAHGQQVIARLHAGTCWLNHYQPMLAGAPLGGFRQAATGGANARSALEPYTRLKHVYAQLDGLAAPR